MPIAFDAATSGPELTGSESSISWSHTCSGADRHLAVCVRTRDTTATTGLGLATGVTYNGVAMTLAEEIEYPTAGLGNACAQIWSLANPPSGSHSIVVSWGGNVARGGAGAISHTGVSQSSPIAASNSAMGESTVTGLLVSAALAGQVALDSIYSMATDASATGPGQTERELQQYGVGSFSDLGAISTIGPVGAPGDVDFEWTHAGGESAFWAAVAVVLAEAAGGGGTSIDANQEFISLASLPALVSSSRSVSAQIEAIILSASTATISSSRTVSGNVEAVTVSALPSLVSSNRNVAGGLESISLQGMRSEISLGINAQAEQITLSTLLAAISSDRSVSGQVESISIESRQASISVGSAISGATELISLEALPALVGIDFNLSAQLQSIVLTELGAQVSLGTMLEAALQSLVLTPQGATLTTSTGITAKVESLHLAAFRASITSPVIPIDVPGLQYTISGDQMHYTLPVHKLHFTFRN